MLDSIDYKLCELLQTRGRASQLELAQAVNLSQPAVAERIRKLEEQGVITGYAAQVFTNHPRYHEGFVKKVTAIDEVQECHRVAGTDSYLLKIRTENTTTLDMLIARIRSIDGCERTQTTIVMATLKESTHVSPALPPDGTLKAATPKIIHKSKRKQK
jgi:Lrp/AsnC family transcriptional regulator, leucine-responsive regulatory protein